MESISLEAGLPPRAGGQFAGIYMERIIKQCQVVDLKIDTVMVLRTHDGKKKS